MKYDVIIVGGGIVGLSTAWHLVHQVQGLRVLIVEKERDIALHQTGHNSGVIHSGIYYKPGSLRARNCKTGYDLLLDFCERKGVDYDICGKVIVAVDEEEVERLEKVYERGVANGLEGIRMISGAEVREIEPHIEARAGIWVPQTGIVHFPDVARKMLEDVQSYGGRIRYGARVTGVTTDGQTVTVKTTDGTFTAGRLINCAGLYADKIAGMTGDKQRMRIVPFRGEYYRLKPEKTHLIRNLVYPTPNPAFPFLGVHFTRMIKGGIEAGPNAVLAFAREGYTKTAIHLPELAETLAFPGFRRLAKKHWRFGLNEMKRSFSKRRFYESLRRMLPELEMSDIVYYRAGVRAMALDDNGEVVDDFIVSVRDNIINVWNAPSPAATASLAIGRHIVEQTGMVAV